MMPPPAQPKPDDAEELRGVDAGAPVVAPMLGDDLLDFEMMEALFFAYRDFISSADRQLAQLGFGRAHHRVLHFVNRAPGLTVAELLEPLAITKQSLSRTLRQLVDAGLVVQRTHGDDRRQRHLYPTASGRALTLSLAEPQSRRIAEALRAMGDGTTDYAQRRTQVRSFLEGMVAHRGGPKAAADATRNPNGTALRDGA